MTKTTRIAYWDNIKALLIILVVFGHFILKMQDTAKIFDYMHDAIYMFHMPAFIFVSGYFSKSDNSRSKKSLVKLLWAYILINIVFIIISLINGGVINLTKPYYTSWYLLSLIYWRLTVNWISKHKHALVVMITIAILIGFCNDVTEQFSIKRTIAFYPFFLMGYLLEKDKIDKMINLKLPTKIITGTGVLAIGAGLEIAGHKLFKYEDLQLTMGIYGENIIFPIARISLFIIACVIIFGILIIVPNRDMGIISKIGRNTLSIFILHRPFIVIIQDLYLDVQDTNVLLAIAIIGTTIMVLIFGTDKVSNFINNSLNKLAEKSIRR